MRPPKGSWMRHYGFVINIGPLKGQLDVNWIEEDRGYDTISDPCQYSLASVIGKFLSHRLNFRNTKSETSYNGVSWMLIG